MNERVVEHLRELNKTLTVIRDLSASGAPPKLASVVLACQQSILAEGAHAEAVLVSRVSEVDVGAGYDIDSFHGSSGSLKPDRFVEVKASTSSHLRFFWTRNEYETAVRLKGDYFIYFLAAFDPALGLAGVNIRMIEDPARTLPELPNVKIEPEAYLVEERLDDVVEISALTGELPFL